MKEEKIISYGGRLGAKCVSNKFAQFKLQDDRWWATAHLFSLMAMNLKLGWMQWNHYYFSVQRFHSMNAQCTDCGNLWGIRCCSRCDKILCGYNEHKNRFRCKHNYHIRISAENHFNRLFRNGIRVYTVFVQSVKNAKCGLLSPWCEWKIAVVIFHLNSIGVEGHEHITAIWASFISTKQISVR